MFKSIATGCKVGSIVTKKELTKYTHIKILAISLKMCKHFVFWECLYFLIQCFCIFCDKTPRNTIIIIFFTIKLTEIQFFISVF